MTYLYVNCKKSKKKIMINQNSIKKSYLYKLSSKALNNINNNERNALYLNKYLREYNNKGTKLQNSNMMNS